MWSTRGAPLAGVPCRTPRRSVPNHLRAARKRDQRADSARSAWTRGLRKRNRQQAGERSWRSLERGREARKTRRWRVWCTIRGARSARGQPSFTIHLVFMAGVCRAQCSVRRRDIPGGLGSRARPPLRGRSARALFTSIWAYTTARMTETASKGMKSAYETTGCYEEGSTQQRKKQTA